ncbi:MAG TPA: EAL domain-containing protein, partial [Henriciella marina]|nr:EAL domain-containing protein [Henriciella marina]
GHDFLTSDVTLEITESVALRNLAANAEALQEARRAGMKIALDDFGTGYSSLSLLSRLPLDMIKIDQSLVHAASRNGDSTETAILRGALRLARELGLVTCVEGVSSEEMALQMKIFGADQIQGYWVGRPQLVAPRPDNVKLAS